MKHILLLVIAIGMILGGCGGKSSRVNPSPAALVAADGDQLWLYKDKSLVRINAPAKHEEAAYTIPDEYLPVNYEYGKTFKVSRDESLVVWFVPAKGLVRWSSKDKNIKIVYEPTTWFYENPYFQFFGETHDLLLIDKKGTEVVKLNLDTDASTTQTIPYPFGTIFKLSPDTVKILYVEGYQQTSGTPQYLITDIDGKEIAKIKTNAEVADRTMVGWAYDSNRIITIENQNELVSYSLNESHERFVMYTFTQNERAVELKQQDEWLFIGSRSYWYLFDTKVNKLLKRLPIEAMSQLNKPQFIFSGDTGEKFFIEETVRAYETMHKRMWVSDWMGSKAIVVPEYGVSINQSVIF